MADFSYIKIQDKLFTVKDKTARDNIQIINTRLDNLGSVFVLKGSVATKSQLPLIDNNVGDVYYVKDESAGYIWIEDNNVLRWELLGLTVDLSNYITSEMLETLLQEYQPLLESGINIKTINNNSLLGSGNITINAEEPTIQKITPVKTSNVGASSLTPEIYKIGKFCLYTFEINVASVLGNGAQILYNGFPIPKGNFIYANATDGTYPYRLRINNQGQLQLWYCDNTVQPSRALCGSGMYYIDE